MFKIDLKNFNFLDNIFEFFKNWGYSIESDKAPFPVSELIDKDAEGEAWKESDGKRFYLYLSYPKLVQILILRLNNWRKILSLKKELSN